MKALLIVTTLMAVSLSALGQSKDSKDSDKLDLKKLEDKYWAAKDTDFSVVQNRLYTKDHRFFANLGFGNIVNDAYSAGHISNFEAGYYWSERWGASVGYESFDLKDNDSTEAFEKLGTVPDYNRSKNYTSASLIWVPFYAKMSFLDTKILYFDMQFSAGVGTKTYTIRKQLGDEDKSAFGYHFNFSQHLFFHNHWALRLDLKNEWSNQDRARYYGNASTLGPLNSNTINDTSLILGLTYFFGSGNTGSDK